MRGWPFHIQAIARAASYAAVAAAIAATALHFRHDAAGRAAPVSTLSTASDPLAHELARCEAIGMAAKDDDPCEAAWAENRRRFFSYRPPTDYATSPATTSKSR